MNKIKIRKIILLIILAILILEIAISMLATIKINNFYKEVNGASVKNNWTVSFLYRIYFDTDKNSIFKSPIEAFLPLIFLTLAIIYAFSKNKDSNAIRRKWPYIVLIVLFALATLYFGLYKVSGFNIISRMSPEIPDKIQNQINLIYSNYSASINLYSIMNLVLPIVQIIGLVYLLILTINIKNFSDINYSKKVSEFKKENNELP